MRTSTARLRSIRFGLFGLVTACAVAGCDRRTSDPPARSASVREAEVDTAPTVSDRVRVLMDADPLLSPAARMTTIVVTDGVVALHGTAASEAERVRLGRIAAVIVGDERVRNEIRVADAAAGTPSSTGSSPGTTLPTPTTSTPSATTTTAPRTSASAPQAPSGGPRSP